MDFTTPTSPEEIIIATLAAVSANGKTLLSKVQIIKPGFTKQALYVILRRLSAEEIIIKHATRFSLSSLWLGKMADFFATAQERYGTRRENVDFLNLVDGDKISYSFKNPAEADRFWGHAFDILLDYVPDGEPVYIYNPHEWFIFARTESELHLFNKIKGDKRHLWLAAGNRDPLDMHAKQYFDGTYLQYHMLDKPLFEKKYYYLNVFGTYLIEAYIDPITADAIDRLYKNTVVYDEDVQKQLQSLVTNGKTKLTISRNERKARKFKKMLGQYFFQSTREGLVAII